MNRPVRTAPPLRVTSETSTTPRDVETSTRRRTGRPQHPWVQSCPSSPHGEHTYPRERAHNLLPRPLQPSRIPVDRIPMAEPEGTKEAPSQALILVVEDEPQLLMLTQLQ